MNKAELIGRLTKDPVVRYGQHNIAVARFILAVNRLYKKENMQEADFISCVAVGKTAELIEKYFYKGLRVSVVGKIQSGNYINNDGYKVYTTEVFIEEVQSLERLDAEGRHNRTENTANEDESPAPEDGCLDNPASYDMEFPFN